MSRTSKPLKFVLVLLAVCAAAAAGCSKESGKKKYHNHPYLSQSPWPIIHHSSFQEAATKFRGPVPSSSGTVAKDWYAYPSSEWGPGPVLFDSNGNVLLMKVDIFVKKHFFIKYNPDTMKEISSFSVSIPDPLGGLYSFVDNSDCWWNGYSAVLSRICSSGSTMSEDLHLDLSSLYPGQMMTDDSIVAMSPLYSSPGMIDVVFVTQGMKSVHESEMLTKVTTGARAGVLRVNKDRSTELFLKNFSTDENISNSFAIDPEGGIYITTNKYAYKLRLEQGTEGEELKEAWKVAYDSGPPIPSYPCPMTTSTEMCVIKAFQSSVKFADGTGTTPTLMGPNQEYVSFFDGARPMKLVVLRTKDGSSVDNIDQPIPFPEPASQTENTISAFGDVFAVENNYSYGAAAYKITGDYGDETIALLWTNSTIFAPNAVPMISGDSNMFYVFEMQNKDPNYTFDVWNGDPDWYVTALDLDTGDVVWQQFIGNGISFNSVYAPLSMDDRGRMYIGLFGGLLRVR